MLFLFLYLILNSNFRTMHENWSLTRLDNDCIYTIPFFVGQEVLPNLVTPLPSTPLIYEGPPGSRGVIYQWYTS